MKCSNKLTATTLFLFLHISLDYRLLLPLSIFPLMLCQYHALQTHTHTHAHTPAHTDATQSVYCPILIDIHNLFCTFVGWEVRARAPPTKRVTCVLFNGLWPRKDKQLFRLIVYGIINWIEKLQQQQN